MMISLSSPLTFTSLHQRSALQGALTLRNIVIGALFLGGAVGCQDEAEMMQGDARSNRPLSDIGVDEGRLKIDGFASRDLATSDDFSVSGGEMSGGEMSGGEMSGGEIDDMGVGGEEDDDAGVSDQGGVERDAAPPEDQGAPPPLAFLNAYWSATHNSYEGGERGSIIEQLNLGVRALEYDLHDNDFSAEGYRLGHFQFGDAVEYGGGNPNSDALGPWLEIINEWSADHSRHAPLILTLDLKDNLTDNRSYDEGNLAHLNDILRQHLDHIWTPLDGLDSIEEARGHTLCILSGDGGTRRAYLSDRGRSPSLSINTLGRALETHDSGSGNLWYWGGSVTQAGITWRRHGQYDTGRRPTTLISAQGDVVEVHQSESRNRLWASTGSLSNVGELSLASADDFSDGEWPSLRWIDEANGRFSLRYQRSGQIYEREGSANFSRQQISWGNERDAMSDVIYSRREALFRGKTYRVSDNEASAEYPLNTLWLHTSGGGETVEGPIRYEPVCFVEWQRNEYLDGLLGLQPFGALPSGGYSSLPDEVRSRYVIRAWEYSGRDVEAPNPQIPSTDYPASRSYQDFIEALGAIE